MPVPDNIPSKPLIPDIEELIAAVAKDVAAPVAPVAGASPVAPMPTVSAPQPPTVTIPASTPVLALVNKSTVVPDSEVSAVAAALQTQVTRDFGPIWKSAAEIVAVPTGGTPPPHAWLMEVLDDAPANLPGVLGYHDSDAQDNPEAFDYANTGKKYGEQWSLTASHELLELLADQWAVNCVFVQTSNTTGALYPLEVGDPVESAAAGYLIDNVLVSDFATPEWFDNSLAPGSAKFDFCGHLTKPLEVMHGGYVSICTVTASSGWSQINAMGIIGKAPDYNDDPRHRR